MRSKTITVTEAVRHFSEYLGRVAYRRESFLLRKGKRTLAELRPAPVGIRLGDLARLLEALPRLSAEEADDFARDLRDARDQANKDRLRDPWDS